MSLSVEDAQELKRRLDAMCERAPSFSSLKERTLLTLQKDDNNLEMDILLRKYLDIAANHEFAGPSADYHRAALKELYSILINCEALSTNAEIYHSNWRLVDFLLSKIDQIGKRQRKS